MMNRRFLLLNINAVQRSYLDGRICNEINTNICNSYIASACVRLFGVRLDNAVCVNNIGRLTEELETLPKRAAQCDVALLFMQDQLRADTADGWYEIALRHLDALAETDIPLICLSLAANAPGGYSDNLPESLSGPKRRFFEALSRRSRSLAVRGTYTGHVLERLGITNFAVVGCPSYFEEGKGRVVRSFEDAEILERSVGVTGGFRLSSNLPWVRYYLQGDFEWKIAELACRPGGSLITTPEERAWMTQENFIDVLWALMEDRTHFFTNFREWKAHISTHCAVVVGNRLHGSIVAANAGIPAIVTNRDARARESCEYLGICHVPEGFPADTKQADLYAACDVDAVNARYNVVYQRFSDWADSVGLPIQVENTELPDINKDLRRPSCEQVNRRVCELLYQRSRDLEGYLHHTQGVLALRDSAPTA